MPDRWDSSRCNESSGFLFRHECLHPADARCERCGKPVCEDHLDRLYGKQLCTTCSRKQSYRGGTARDRRHADDPYTAGDYYYGDYGSYGGYRRAHSSREHDPHDFTEADSESLASEMDNDFENDMSES